MENKKQNWRDSYDYRNQYFKGSKGVLGVYYCPYCYTPLTKKDQIDVDHIIPPSKFIRRDSSGRKLEETNIIAELMNSRFNLIASCKACNKVKSDKIEARYLVQGGVGKAVEVAYNTTSTASKATLKIASKTATLGGKSFLVVVGYFINLSIKVIISPFTSKKVSLKVKLFTAIVYFVVIYLILN